MTTCTLTDTRPESLDWDPITGFEPAVMPQYESQETLTVLIDAVMAEWNPRAAEQLGRIEFQTSRVPSLQDEYHSHLGFTKLPSVHGYNSIEQR